MPKQSTDLDELELSGWDEIRKALEEVEELRKNGLDARVEVDNSYASPEQTWTSMKSIFV